MYGANVEVARLLTLGLSEPSYLIGIMGNYVRHYITVIQRRAPFFDQDLNRMVNQ